MIEISNLRKYRSGIKTTKLEVDIKFIDIDFAPPAETIWFEMDANYDSMLVDDTYDPFLLTSLYLAMYNKTDLRIRGNISKKLYKNLMWYGQKIFCDFSDKLSRVEIIIDGFAPTQAQGNLIGAGVSCGVDSLSTIYDRFINEDDPDYKINSLFFFNCGSHGAFDDETTQKVFISRGIRSINFARELNLPIYIVDSNLKQFHIEDDHDALLFLSFYSCVLSLQNEIRRYYIPAGFSYDEIKSCGVKYADYDLAGFCESFFVPLIQTERTELVIDGCQLRRVDKIKNIADWKIAQKYLNVCLLQRGSDSTNCSFCSKCVRTLLPLEIFGKLDKFAEVFDLEDYREHSFKYKCHCVEQSESDPFFKEILDLAKENNFPMPTIDKK